ncbi:MAG TPA: alpha/beta fold hydrolase [Rhizobiales bacterium]|nr:alpha/beta fold hydrolase [Hyphomicrobiales bacterium]
MAVARLTLLGGFALADKAGAALPLGRKDRALLAYLALQPGWHAREKLAALLWGGADDASARTSLRQALSSIRRALGPDGSSALPGDGDRVALTGDAVETDARLLEALVADDDPGALERAIALFRGPLLDGLSLREESFDDWLRTERERLHALTVTAAEKLLAHVEAANDWAGCVRVATRLLVLEPLREDAHRALMRAYAAQGRPGLALKQFERCREIVRVQLGIGPESGTVALYEAIRSRRRASAVDLAASAPAVRKPDDFRPPPTRYVKSGGCNIAYQVSGGGDFDLLYVPGWVSNLDSAWSSPRVRRVFERLGSFARLIRIDKRGTGLSDRNVGLATLEQRMEDVRAVLDAVGSNRTVLFGSSEGGNLCILFAATYPERTAALVLHGCFARGLWAPDYPWAKTREELEQELAEIERDWGEPADMSKAAPSLMADEAERAWFAAYLRNSASPADALALWRWNTEIDVRAVLPAIRVPTLILQRTGDRWVRPEEGRYLASHIDGARYVEIPGEDHLIWGDAAERLGDEIEAFVTGAPPPTRPRSRFLAALLCLSAAVSGDAWRDVEKSLRRACVAAGAAATVSCEDILVVAFAGPVRAIECALTLRRQLGERVPHLRAAIHVGECEYVDAVPVGPAVMATIELLRLCDPGGIIVSRAVRDLVVGAGLEFAEAGEMQLPGGGAIPICVLQETGA